MSDTQPNHLDQLKLAEERDQEWLKNVYRGDQERDLTPRAIIAGMIFGGLMSLSNLYVGLKSGWGLGVDIAAVIVIFAVFKALRGAGLVKNEIGMQENTIVMTVSVAASWISSAGLVSAIPALTMLTGYQFIWWQLTLFIGVVLLLGLFMAIPLKRQMVQVDSLRFPGNVPTGETIKAMYAQGTEGMKKAKAMGISGLLGMIIAGLRDGPGWIPAQFNLGWHINRIGLNRLTLGFEPSLIFISIGALFGMKVGLSMLLGLVLNYAVLAPQLINDKIVHHAAPQIRATAVPQFPLTVAAGQTFTVVLTEATATPELAPDTAFKTLAYTWSQPVTLCEPWRDSKRFVCAHAARWFAQFVRPITCRQLGLEQDAAHKCTGAHRRRGHKLGRPPRHSHQPTGVTGGRPGLQTRRFRPAKCRRLPQHQRLVPLARCHCAGRGRLTSARLPMAYLGPHLRQYLYRF